MLPSRRQDLLLEELEDETVVYDPVRFKAHCLNRTARLVFAHCDGKTSVTRLAALLQTELKQAVDEKVIWQALEQLGRAQLLEEPIVPPASRPVSRRGLAQQMAAVGAVVFSVAVPTAALAAATLNCCVGSCSGGSCCPKGSDFCRACRGDSCPSGCCKPTSAGLTGCNFEGTCG